MSQTIILAAREDGDLLEEAKFENAFLGTMTLWRQMGKRYSGISDQSFLLKVASGSSESVSAIWDLANDEKVPIEDRITLTTTFDGLLVPRDHISVVADAMKKTAEWLEAPHHIGKQAEFLEKCLDDPTIVAIAWNQTSANWDAWRVPDGEGGARPYNIYKDHDHELMFEEEEESEDSTNGE